MEHFSELLLKTHCASCVWNDQIACYNMTHADAFEPNTVHKLLPVYIYGLVRRGWIRVQLDECMSEARAGDMVIYMPGLNLNTVDVSDDYEAQTLYVAGSFATDNHMYRRVLQTAYSTIVGGHTPVIHLGSEAQQLLSQALDTIMLRLRADHPYKLEALQAAYSLFLSDLTAAQSTSQPETRITKREEAIFVQFMHLVRDHYAKHHDIGFYADSCNISTTYLSRVVRHATGRTVQDFISSLLLMEASQLIVFTDSTMCEIASRLNFSDQAAFSKFFFRMRGVCPLEFRKQHRM